jgi:hypothetical protein
VCVCVSAVFWGGLLGDFYFLRVVGGWVVLEGGFLFWAMRFVKGMRRARIRIWITGRESLFPFCHFDGSGLEALRGAWLNGNLDRRARLEAKFMRFVLKRGDKTL